MYAELCRSMYKGMNKYEQECTSIELDGVGPVDNRTLQRLAPTPCKKKNTCDT